MGTFSHEYIWLKENDQKVSQQNEEKNQAMARKDSKTKERLFVCVCVHFNIKDVSMNLAMINEGKTKIKYKKRNSNCFDTSKRQKRSFLPVLMIL